MVGVDGHDSWLVSIVHDSERRVQSVQRLPVRLNIQCVQRREQALIS